MANTERPACLDYNATIPHDPEASVVVTTHSFGQPCGPETPTRHGPPWPVLSRSRCIGRCAGRGLFVVWRVGDSANVLTHLLPPKPTCAKQPNASITPSRQESVVPPASA